MTGCLSYLKTMLKVVACIPTYEEERDMGRVVLLARKYVDGVEVLAKGEVHVA